MTVAEVSPGVWRAGTRYVNWYMVDGGSRGLTLIDAGLPAYVRQLDRSLSEIGRDKRDVRAVVLTHGHIDHIGMAATLAGLGATIYLHPADTHIAHHPLAAKPERNPARYAFYPGMLAFLAHALTHGALRPAPMPEAAAITDGATVDVPGEPVAIHAPGHTDGSCVLEFREHGVVFVGDLLCTLSPFTGRRASPQLQTRGSNKSSGQAMSSLGRLESVRARVVLPGHGTPWRDGVESAVASAKRIGCR
jgi:glyoxylase-like metal-dependent hydrolase (beta-lactamase superfamily II)